MISPVEIAVLQQIPPGFGRQINLSPALPKMMFPGWWGAVNSVSADCLQRPARALLVDGAVGHLGRPDRQDRVMATMPRKTIAMPTMRPNVSNSPSKTDALTVENTRVSPIAIG